MAQEGKPEVPMKLLGRYEDFVCRLQAKLGEPKVERVGEKVATWWVTHFRGEHFVLRALTANPVSHGKFCTEKDPIAWQILGESDKNLENFVHFLSDGEFERVLPEPAGPT